MTTLQFFPPPLEVAKRMTEIPGAQLAAGVISSQEGPDGNLGPESAGAVLMLQMTFVDQQRAETFWGEAVVLMELLANAPGFIRRFGFAVGPCAYLIALWRTVDDAKTFAATPQHQAAVRALYKQRWQYSHFSAIWELHSSNDRIIFCDACEGITPALEGRCNTCGAPFADALGMRQLATE